MATPLKSGMKSSGSRAMPLAGVAVTPTALRAFADGFGGGLMGGLVYCPLVAYFQPGELELAYLRVLALSLIFGSFEIWRVTRVRTLRNLRTCVLWTFAGSLFALWALGVFVPTATGVHGEAPAYLNRV